MLLVESLLDDEDLLEDDGAFLDGESLVAELFHDVVAELLLADELLADELLAGDEPLRVAGLLDDELLRVAELLDENSLVAELLVVVAELLQEVEVVVALQNNLHYKDAVHLVERARHSLLLLLQ